jgi:hypothetical protein
MNDAAIEARKEAFQLLEAVVVYAGMAQEHLRHGDDAGALYDLARFREYAVKALATFKPLHEMMKERGRPTRLESAE